MISYLSYFGSFIVFIAKVMIFLVDILAYFKLQLIKEAKMDKQD